MAPTRPEHAADFASKLPPESASLGAEKVIAVRVGCAGWSIPSRHAAWFAGDQSQLARYATRFDFAEINSTFYRQHRPQTFERWAASVPTHFRFSVKLPKQITHDARLQGAGDALSAFRDGVAGLGQNLGGVLVQLPPSLAFDARVANRFFAMLRRRFSAPVACEPRHPSWFEPNVDSLWQRYGLARVAADPARIPAGGIAGGAGASAGWSYWRWHGSPRIYYSRYDDAALQELAHALRERARADVPAWCVLDNTALGHAVEDAARLQELVRA